MPNPRIEHIDKSTMIVEHGEGSDDPSLFGDMLQVFLDKHPNDPYIKFAGAMSREMAERVIGMLTRIRH